MKTIEITENGYRKVKLSDGRTAYRSPNNQFCSSRAFNVSKSKTGVITEGGGATIPKQPNRYRVNCKVKNYGESGHKVWVKSRQYIKAKSSDQAREQAYFRLLSMGFNLSQRDYEIGIREVNQSGTSRTKWKHKDNQNYRKKEHTLRDWL